MLADKDPSMCYTIPYHSYKTVELECRGLVSVSSEVTNMSQAEHIIPSSIVAVYPDHDAAEHAVRRLHETGIAMSDLSIVGRDFQTTEEPVGFVSAKDYATAGAATGAWFGGLFGLCIGAAFLILPGIGPVVVAGPLTAAVVAGIEGALAGTALGSLGARSLAGVFPGKRRSNTRRTSRGVNSLSWSGASPRLSPAPRACSANIRPSTSISTVPRRLDSSPHGHDNRQSVTPPFLHAPASMQKL